MNALGFVAGVMICLLLTYAISLALLWAYARRHPDAVTLRNAMRLLPDVLRLVKRLASDPSLPRALRWRLLGLLAFLAMPFDLVPDFLPVIGYADDAILVAMVLRSVVRRAGPEALDQHWPGTPQGLALVRQLAGITP